MPRMMTAVRPFEFVITPKVTYINFENNQPRRIYTDGRGFPKDDEPTWSGYSIGGWLDSDNDGRFDTLEVETRNFKGPASMKPHRDHVDRSCVDAAVDGAQNLPARAQRTMGGI